MVILFLMSLYHFTKRVIKRAVKCKGLLFPDFEKFYRIMDFDWEPWGKLRMVKLYLFYYVFYMPCVLLMFFIDGLFLFVFLSFAYQIIIRITS